MIKNYIVPNAKNWKGRVSSNTLYLHEVVKCLPIDDFKNNSSDKNIVLLGYSSDDGVKRNQGRIGASMSPDAIRMQLGKMPNHLSPNVRLFDLGDLTSPDGDVEAIQKQLIQAVDLIKCQNGFPIILGGGHDLAYGHFNGLLKQLPDDKTIGIINFDAHFDLRPNDQGNNSGTPFYQIAEDQKAAGTSFRYFALGIRADANTKDLYEFAEANQAFYLQCEYFNISFLEHVQLRLMQFIEDVDYLYTTIDLDGFSSAYAPGVSAASPMGFSPDIVLECLKLILESGKLSGVDVVELNPNFDVDDQTAKLAASLIHYVIHHL